MDKKPLDIDTGNVSLTLKRSSWENLFRVITWCAPMATDEDVYRAQTGEFWTLANFWASIHHLQSQFKPSYRDPDDDGNSVKYLTGEECIEPGCGYPAGTAWSPRWCFSCNVKRMDHIVESLRQIKEGPWISTS